MKLSKWAKEKGISYITAYRWAKSGKIKGLFRGNKGYINADLNGALNIGRKVVGEYQYPIEVCSTPKIINLI